MSPFPTTTSGRRPRTRQTSQFQTYGTPDNGGYTASAQRTTSGSAMPNYGTQQQAGGFPAVPQQGQRSAPDMSMYGQGNAARFHGGSRNFNESAGQYQPSMPPSQGAPPAGGGMVNGAPVANLRDPQEQIDALIRAGTWDHPQNAAVRERLLGEKARYDQTPPGYFMTPDGRLEPNYIVSLMGGQAASPPTASAGRAQALPPAQQGPLPPVQSARSLYMPTPPAAAASPAAPPRPAPPVPGPGSTFAYSAPQSPVAETQRFVFPDLVNTGNYFNPDFRQRDAFIASIVNSLGEQQMANMGGSQMVPPTLNFPALWSQAGNMVQDGWTNPLAGLFGG